MTTFAEEKKKLGDNQIKFFIKTGIVTVVMFLLLTLLWNPMARPWEQERKGVANLAQKRFENMIQAEASAAEKDAAVLRAQAIAIVGEAAKAFPEYRSQEFIGGFAEAMKNGDIDQTFYIPTQNSIPVLPAMSR